VPPKPNGAPLRTDNDKVAIILVVERVEIAANDDGEPSATKSPGEIMGTLRGIL
jgi:hypothetical protein